MPAHRFSIKSLAGLPSLYATKRERICSVMVWRWKAVRVMGRFVSMLLVYRRRRSVAVADVPGARLDRAGHIGAVGDCLTDLLATLLFSDDLGSVVCHHHGEHFFVGHLGFGHGSFRFDGISLQGQGISQAPGRTLL